MGECTFTPRFGDFGDRKHTLDIGPTWPEPNKREDSDSHGIINGGPGGLVVRTEGKR